MWLSLSSSSWSDLELGDYAKRYLVDQFSSVKNVGRILVGGLRELSIRVWIDPIKLAANDLTIQEVENALRGENIRLPAGRLIFSPRMAVSTSLIVKSLAASLIGSIQTLILNSLNPPTLILPTFLTLEN